MKSSRFTNQNAILQYLCEAYGNHGLWSTDPRQRALIAQWLFWECAHWQPVLTGLLSPSVGHRLLPNVLPRPQAGPEWNAADLQALLQTLTLTLSQSAYLAGSDLSIADFAVAGMMTYFRYTEFPFEHHSEISNWYQRIEALEGWQASQDPLWSA